MMPNTSAPVKHPEEGDDADRAASYARSMEALQPPEGFVRGYSSKIPKADRAEVVRRRRAGESRKSIAAEYECDPCTVSRAIRAELQERGDYDPEGWTRHLRQRRKEGWEYIQSVWTHRDKLQKIERQNAALAQAQIEDMDARVRREHA